MHAKRGGVQFTVRFRRVVEYDGDGIVKNNQRFSSVFGNQIFNELKLTEGKIKPK